MQISGPFFNLKEAARYCGYAPNTFGRKLHEYEIPRCGPGKNRFAKSVLDAWMANPKDFLKGRTQYRRKRTPIKVVI